MPRVDILKALDVSAAGTVLVQPEIDKVVAQIVDYRNPLRQNLPRKKGSGDAWHIIRRTPSGTTPAAWVADSDDIVEDEGTYTKVSFYYKTIVARVKVTRKMQAIGRSYADILADEIEARALEFRDKEDYAYVIGASSANSSSKEFMGLMYQLQSAAQTVACAASTTPGSLTLAKMDEAMDLSTGNIGMIIMSKKTRRLLNALLQANQRFVNTVKVKGGFVTLAYNEAPIFTSNNIPNTVSYAADGTTVSALSGGTASFIEFVDLDHVWVGELTPVTVMPLAKTTSQYDVVDIYCDETLVVRNPYTCALLTNIGA